MSLCQIFNLWISVIYYHQIFFSYLFIYYYFILFFFFLFYFFYFFFFFFGGGGGGWGVSLRWKMHVFLCSNCGPSITDLTSQGYETAF